MKRTPMKRGTTTMKRRPMARGKTRLAPVSKKRKVQEHSDAKVRAHVLARAAGRCEVLLAGWRCDLAPQDTHHVVKRSQRGPTTPDNLVAVCRWHHDETDWPYRDGKLAVTPLGGERFTFAVQYADDKFTLRATKETP